MKKTLIVVPFLYNTTVSSLQLVNDQILNLVGRINIEDSYFNSSDMRTLNVIPYKGILTEEQKYAINECIKNAIADKVITGIAFIEGEEEQFSQTMQLK